MKENKTRVAVGVLTVLISVVCVIYFAPRLSRVYDLRSLKWFPVLTAFIGFYIAG